MSDVVAVCRVVVLQGARGERGWILGEEGSQSRPNVLQVLEFGLDRGEETSDLRWLRWFSHVRCFSHGCRFSGVNVDIRCSTGATLGDAGLLVDV